MDYFIVELTNQQKIAIPLEQIQELIKVNYGDICPIPGVKKAVLGVVSQRGILLWLLDLSLLLHNISSFSHPLGSATVLVTKIGKNTVGLVVKKLGEIKEFLESHILVDDSGQKSSLFSLNDYINHCLKDQEELLPVLNLSQIQTYLNPNLKSGEIINY